MNYKFTILLVIIIVSLGFGLFFLIQQNSQPKQNNLKSDNNMENVQKEDFSTAIIAGGCFWCVEADMEKLDGVVSVVSGYSGGENENPTYENYYKGGHREVAKVKYDSEKLSYRQLLTYFLKHIDPTDGDGQFGDRGEQYAPAIYYQNKQEKKVAQKVLDDISSRGVFEEELQVPLIERKKFWPAEDYHQDYYKKSSLKYKFYRKASGRNSFIKNHWGDSADELPPRNFENQKDGGDFQNNGDENKAEKKSQQEDTKQGFWKNFEKPNQNRLRQILTSLEYEVTQEDGTEPAYDNQYWDNEREGIYVDVISGEPLFSSKHKYESGTGWPSFYKPLEPENIKKRKDEGWFTTRTEVRSKYADSHLGHVFKDGPEPTGLRYCVNSAALEFIPKDKLKEEGYGEYVSHFEK